MSTPPQQRPPHRVDAGSTNADAGRVPDALARRFNAAASRDQDTVYQFRFDVGPPCHAHVRRGTLRAVPGIHPTPTLTMWFDTEDSAVGFIEGTLDVMAAFMAGHLRADGHIVLAMTLPLVFSGPDTPPPPRDLE